MNTPEELAKDVARIAHDIERIIVLTYQEGNDHSRKQFNYFQTVVIDTITIEQFADMAAQTICYGLFMAKHSEISTTPSLANRKIIEAFSRFTAPHFLPNTDPILARLINDITRLDLDERLVQAIDNLIALLNRTEIRMILDNVGHCIRQEDLTIHFYEKFLAYYNPKLREARGVYYTPKPVVSYIIRSIDWILKEKFNLPYGLADNQTNDNAVHKVHIVDPAMGTGVFLQAVFAKIYQDFPKNQGTWSDYVTHHLLPRISGFELLIPAYIIARTKLSLQLQATDYQCRDEKDLPIFLTNTLEHALFGDSNVMKHHSPTMVILGNPPYSGHSDNIGSLISELLHGIGDETNYFMVDGKPLNERNSKWLNDDYVKFIRFAQWTIKRAGEGILGFVTNHGYLDNPTFRGMRQTLMQDFDEIYILDLHGNIKKKRWSPDGKIDENVFDIQQGVAIGIFIKYRREKSTSLATTYHAHLYGDRNFKYQYLLEKELKNTEWIRLQPFSPFYWFIPQNTDLLAEYQQGWKITDMMPVKVLGFQTHRDHFAIDFEKEKLLERIAAMRCNSLSDQEYRYQYNLPDTHDWKLAEARALLRQEPDWQRYVTTCLYRPFDLRYCYFSKIIIERPRKIVQDHIFAKDNLSLLLPRQLSTLGWRHVGVTNGLAESCALSTKTKEGNYNFPLYLYPTEKEAGLARKANFSVDFVKQLETSLHLQFTVEGKGDFISTISALDVFDYIYAILHSPNYRQRYAEYLQIDFPRLPVVSDRNLFKQISELGRRLVEIHLMKGNIENNCDFPILQGNYLIGGVSYRDNKVYINKTQYFDKVNVNIWEFYLGGYQVCEKWLKDRRGRVLSTADRLRYLYILAAVEKTQELMEKIDTTLGTSATCFPQY